MDHHPIPDHGDDGGGVGSDVDAHADVAAQHLGLAREGPVGGDHVTVHDRDDAPGHDLGPLVATGDVVRTQVGTVGDALDGPEAPELAPEPGGEQRHEQLSVGGHEPLRPGALTRGHVVQVRRPPVLPVRPGLVVGPVDDVAPVARQRPLVHVLAPIHTNRRVLCAVAEVEVTAPPRSVGDEIGPRRGEQDEAPVVGDVDGAMAPPGRRAVGTHVDQLLLFGGGGRQQRSRCDETHGRQQDRTAERRGSGGHGVDRRDPPPNAGPTRHNTRPRPPAGRGRLSTVAVCTAFSSPSSSESACSRRRPVRRRRQRPPPSRAR